MAIKVVVNSLDEVPEALHSFYTKIGDEYVLDADDKDFKSKLSEFRNNNIELKKKLSDSEQMQQKIAEMQEQLKNYDGIDAEKAREALEKLQNIEDQKLIDAGKLDELLHQRTERMRGDFQGQIEALTKSLEEANNSAKNYRQRLEEVVIDNSLQQAVSQVATVRKGAMQDILARGRGVWALDDNGSPVPIDSEGNTMYGKDGEKPISMSEWAQALVQEAPYLFEGNVGGGAGGGSGGNEGAGQVSAKDQDSINSNIEAIAAGKIEVSGLGG